MSRSTAATAAAVATGSVSTVPRIEFVPFTSPYSRTASPRPEGVTAALTILRFSTSSSICIGLAQSGRGRSDCACKQPKVEGDAGKMPVMFLLRMSAVKWRFARLFHASGWSYLDSTETTSSRRDGCSDVRTSWSGALITFVRQRDAAGGNRLVGRIWQSSGLARAEDEAARRIKVHGIDSVLKTQCHTFIRMAFQVSFHCL